MELTEPFEMKHLAKVQIFLDLEIQRCRKIENFGLSCQNWHPKYFQNLNGCVQIIGESQEGL